MNNNLMKTMSVLFTPDQQRVDLDRGGSSAKHIEKLIAELIPLFNKYNIQSMFDAGCNDCRIGIAISPPITYYGGDISAAMVADSWKNRPQFNINLHDATTDSFPNVDLLFVKDVSIHLSYADKLKLCNNWMSSDIPWIMITHDEFEKNSDFDYKDGFPFAHVNWEVEPWNFPSPTDVIYEVDNAGRCMALWHRDQLMELI
tara:strand:- start:707 stop:1309 length:603 start_codon:yes stop_codon:yes gene_type:complete